MEREETPYSELDFWRDLPEAIKALPTEEKTAFMYTRGCLKTPLYNSTEGMPDSYAWLFEEWRELYDIYNAQIFSSLSLDKMMGWHTDCNNVILSPIYGSAIYQLKDENDPAGTFTQFEMKTGETLFIPAEKLHSGLGSMYPRVVFSCSTPRDLSPEEVDFHYSELTGDWRKESTQEKETESTLKEFHGRGFKAYRWVDREGNHIGPLYFSTPEKAKEWKDKQNETN